MAEKTLEQLRAAVDRFPETVTAKLRAVAFRTSRNVYARAKQNLIAQQKTPARNLANAMEIEEQADKKQFLVRSEAPTDQPENLPVWIERGTSNMQARPYMRPAQDAEEPNFIKEMSAAALSVAERELT